MIKSTLLFIFLLLGGTTLNGDGKVFWKDEVPPSIPYQRAILLWNEGMETLIVQSKYETKSSSESDLGWVIPVPSIPEVAAISEEGAYMAFMHLGRLSRPEISRPLDVVLPAIFLIFLGIAIFVFLRSRKEKKNIAQLMLFLLLLLLFGTMAIPSFNNVRSSGGVDIIDERSVGIYDTRVIRSERGALLVTWLNENGFRFSKEDEFAFDNHIERGWCFVVAKVNPQAMQASEVRAYDGLIPPLAIRFETSSPVYPLALTATGGHDTEVLIYVLSDTKMLCEERMPLRYAGDVDLSGGFKERLSYDLDPEDFFENEQFNHSYLTKYRGLLTPEQMKEDLVFTPTEDRIPFRERKIVWY